MVKKGNIPWNKGLTKETDERIEKHAKKVSGKGNPMYGKRYKMKEETKEKIRENYKRHKKNCKCACCSAKNGKVWNKGKTNIYNEKTLENIRKNSKKNSAKYWLNKKRSDETIKKMNVFKKGHIPWNKNLTKEVDNRIGNILIKRNESYLFSYPERKLFKKLKKFFPNATRDKFIGRKKPDIILEKEKVCIEFDGKYWHKEIDIDRDKYLNKNGYRVLHFHGFVPKDSLLINIVLEFLKSNNPYYYWIKNNSW